MIFWKRLDDHRTRSFCIDLMLLTGLFSLLYFIFLGCYPLFNPDEARYAEIAREMVETGQYLTPHLNYVLYFEKPVLFYWLLALAIKTFGVSEYVVRLWTAGFGVIGGLMTYAAARKLYDRRTGIYASVILVSSLLYFILGHLVTLDMPLTIFLTATLYCLLIGIQDNTPKKKYYFWGAAIFSACAVLTKGLIGVVFPGLILGFWLFSQNQWKLIKTWPIFSAGILFLILVLPWHVLMQMKHPYFFHFYFINQHFLRYSTLEADRYEPAYFYCMVLLVGLIPWTFFLPQALKHSIPSWKMRKHFPVDVFLLIWIVTIFFFFSFSHSKLIPYLLPIFPPLAILLGRYFSKTNLQNSLGMKIGWGCLPLVGLSAILFFQRLPYEYDVSDLLLTAKFSPVLSAILLLTSILSTFFFFRKYPLLAFHILLIGTAAAWITLLPMISAVDHNSIKPLALSLKKILKPSDEIYNYNRYNQDLPFYLERRINVVNWFTNELAFGIKHQSDTHWMITTDAFWKRWNRPRRVFVVTRLDDLQDILKEHPALRYYPIAKTQRNILISNVNSYGSRGQAAG